ncbi:MAG: molybdenum cofactor guanylyltransferase, partial [Lutimonas sp.]
METHRKHAKLNRRESGFYAPAEIALLGTKCSEIQGLSEHISKELSGKIKIAYADASHSSTLEPMALDNFTFHSSGDLQIRRYHEQNPYQDKLFYTSYDLLLINGNHYPG